MSFGRPQDETKEDEEISKCRSDLSFFKQTAFEKCRMVPSYTAGPGNVYRLLHGHDACGEASQNYIDQLEKCHNLPKFKFK